jgi:hypothetical protein
MYKEVRVSRDRVSEPWHMEPGWMIPIMGSEEPRSEVVNVDDAYRAQGSAAVVV